MPPLTVSQKRTATVSSAHSAFVSGGGVPAYVRRYVAGSGSSVASISSASAASSASASAMAQSSSLSIAWLSYSPWNATADVLLQSPLFFQGGDVCRSGRWRRASLRCGISGLWSASRGLRTLTILRCQFQRCCCWWSLRGRAGCDGDHCSWIFRIVPALRLQACNLLVIVVGASLESVKEDFVQVVQVAGRLRAKEVDTDAHFGVDRPQALSQTNPLVLGDVLHRFLGPVSDRPPAPIRALAPVDVPARR